MVNDVYCDLIDELLITQEPPAAAYSLASGLAGTAYAAWRLGHILSCTDLLAAAALWGSAAGRATQSVTPPRNINGQTPPPGSLLFAQPGAHCVNAVVQATIGERTAADDAIAAFAQSSAEADQLDVTVGLAGRLIGCAFIIEHAGKHQRIPAHLFAVADETYGTLWSCATQSKVNLGLPFAHGLAGVLFALLRYDQLRSRAPHPQMKSMLQRLAEHGRRSGETMWWPITLGENDEQHPMRESWCNGSAGFALLWTLAFELFGDESWLMLARRCAYHAGQCRVIDSATLCCGIVGKAWALVSVYRASREERWLQRARALARAAPTPDDDGLFYGTLGAKLLAAELQDPMNARFPLYE